MASDSRELSILGDRRLHVFGLLAVAVPVFGPAAGVDSLTAAAVGVSIITGLTFYRVIDDGGAG